MFQRDDFGGRMPALSYMWVFCIENLLWILSLFLFGVGGFCLSNTQVTLFTYSIYISTKGGIICVVKILCGDRHSGFIFADLNLCRNLAQRKQSLEQQTKWKRALCPYLNMLQKDHRGWQGRCSCPLCSTRPLTGRGLYLKQVQPQMSRTTGIWKLNIMD